MSTPVADASYQLLAAVHLRKQARQLTRQIDGIRQAEDIEYVHRARVASRRLRAGLGMFADCFHPRTVKRWREAVRGITKGLGEARDADVQIEFLNGVLAGLSTPAHYPGIARLMVQLDKRRAKLQPNVNRALDELEAGRVLGEIVRKTNKLVTTLTEAGTTVAGPAVFHLAGEHVLGRLEEFLAYEGCLENPAEAERHHAMRIAAKRLRYTLEICAPAYGGRLDPSINSVKGVQTLLGDIHDCDVWVEYLQEFLKKEHRRIVKHFGHDRPLARLKAGIDYLEADRRRQRDVLFSKLGDCWAELCGEGVWENLRKTVAGGAGTPSERVASNGKTVAKENGRRAIRVDGPRGSRSEGAEAEKSSSPTERASASEAVQQ